MSTQDLREQLFQGRTYAQIGLTGSRQILRTLRPPGGLDVPLIEDRRLPVEPPVAVRVYHPRPGEERPALLWVHGGGWCLGDVDTTDRVCRELAIRTDCLIVSIDHRLAPEHPFPAPLDDVYNALTWLLDHAADLGARTRQIAVGGESSGANLAAAACIRLLDDAGAAGASGRLVRQLLVVPVADLDPTRASMRRDADSMLAASDTQWFAEQYLPRAADRRHRYAVPMNADNLTGLPDVTMVTAGLDPLRDGALAYLERLGRAAVPTRHLDYAGAGHGFFGSPGSDLGERALADAVADLRWAFSGR